MSKPKSERLFVRCTPELTRAILAISESQMMSISDYVRQAVLKALKADGYARVPSRHAVVSEDELAHLEQVYQKQNFGPELT